jgi:hypothetical protein
MSNVVIDGLANGLLIVFVTVVIVGAVWITWDDINSEYKYKGG